MTPGAIAFFSAILMAILGLLLYLAFNKNTTSQSPQSPQCPQCPQCPSTPPVQTSQIYDSVPNYYLPQSLWGLRDPYWNWNNWNDYPRHKTDKSVNIDNKPQISVNNIKYKTKPPKPAQPAPTNMP